ncbi:MAG: adenylate/guanylate cyclase domain-containing protein [Actinomycetota bacterium]
MSAGPIELHDSPCDRTIVFFDIVGSTAWIDEHGDDAWVALLRRCQPAISEIVDPPMGRLVAWRGDGFLAEFVEPSAALRAILLVLEWFEANGTLVRGSAHHGSVRHLAGDLAGLDVHVAARLADVAEPGTVALSESFVREALPGLVVLLRESRLRGLRSPVGATMATSSMLARETLLDTALAA